MDDGSEFCSEPGRFERDLSVVLVNVELTALRARRSGGVGFVDSRGDAMNVKNAREDEPAEPCADDSDRW